MKKILVILIILSLFNSSVIFAEEDGFSMGNPDTSDWFEWSLPNDKEAYGSAIDASFLLDAPAGKHGWLNADGEKLYFDDGTPARFWGTNITTEGAFQTKENAEILADRIARVGYNMVRIHAIDQPRTLSLFKTGTTRELNPEILDRVFYLIAELKERGVYIFMDLCVYRPALSSEIPFANGGFMEHKKHFVPKMIELQKEYCENLLGVVNPYTGLALKDDPALIVCNLTNESSVAGIGSTVYRQTLYADYYKGIFQGEFNRWLAKHYTSVNELKSAWAEEGKNGLMSGEDFTQGTVKIDVNFEEQNYSAARLYDCRSFTYDLQVRFFTEMRDYLKDVMGYKGLVSGVTMGHNALIPPTNFATKESVDVLGMNDYKSHPNDNVLTSWLSPTAKGGDELFNLLMDNRPYDVPYFIGEWQACFPTHYDVEHWPMLAVFARMENINPNNYCITSSEGLKRQPDWSMNYFFDNFHVGSQTSIQPIAAMIYHRDNIEPRDDVHYRTVYKDDFWTNDAIYHWGNEPRYIWPYGSIRSKYPELGDDVSQSNGESFERMHEKYKNNEPQSSQLNWNQQTGLFRFNSDYSNVALGYVGGLTIDAPYCEFEIENQSATAVLTSATKEPLDKTERFVLALVGRSRFEGMKMDDATGTIVQEWASQAPVIMEPIRGKVLLKITDEIEVYALDSSGKRISEVSFETTAEGYKELKVGAEYKTVHYEIVRANAE